MSDICLYYEEKIDYISLRFISFFFALTIAQAKYIYKRGKVRKQSEKSQIILFITFCGNADVQSAKVMQVELVTLMVKG